MQSSNQPAITIDEKKKKMHDKLDIAERDSRMRELLFNDLQIKVDKFRQLIITDFKERCVKLSATWVVNAFKEEGIVDKCISSHNR